MRDKRSSKIGIDSAMMKEIKALNATHPLKMHEH